MGVYPENVAPFSSFVAPHSGMEVFCKKPSDDWYVTTA
jgi:hypothetical protein